MDKKQVLIVFQNSMMHATNIVKHNSEGKKIKLDDVIAAAQVITEAALKVSKDLGYQPRGWK